MTYFTIYVLTEIVLCHVEEYYHGHVDVAGVELHVDLLVEEGLRFGMVVLTDQRERHL